MSSIAARISRPLLGMSAASGTAMLGTAVLTFALAALLPKDEFGLSRVITAYLIALAMAGTCTFHDAVAMSAAGRKMPQEIADTIYSALVIVSLLSLFVALVFLAGATQLTRWSGDGLRVLAITVLPLPAIAATTVLSSALQVLGTYRQVAAVTIVTGTLPLFIVTPGAWVGGLEGWASARSVAVILCLVVTAWPLAAAMSGGKWVGGIAMTMWRFARVQVLSGILSLAILSADVVILDYVSSDLGEVAIYGLASLVTKSALFIPVAFGRVYFRRVAEPGRAGQREAMALFRTVSIAAVFCGVVLAALSPLVIECMYGPKYAGINVVLVIMSLALVPQFLWHALSIVNIANADAKASLLVALVGAVIGIPAMIILSDSFGAVGAAIGLNITFAAGVLAGGGVFARRYRRMEASV